MQSYLCSLINSARFNIVGATWFIFQTITTIGFGDVYGIGVDHYSKDAETTAHNIKCTVSLVSLL